MLMILTILVAVSLICAVYLYSILLPDQKRILIITAILAIGIIQILVHVGHIFNNKVELSEIRKNAKLEQEQDKKKMERESAIAISFYTWAIQKYTLEHNDELKGISIDFLKELVKENDPYLLGYYYYKSKNYALAKRYLRKAVDNKHYKAPALYLLCVIDREIYEADTTDRDLSDHAKNLENAFNYDDEYSALYIERCIQRLDNKQFSRGLDDLSEAINRKKIHCSHLDQLGIYFENLADTSKYLKRYKAIKAGCQSWWE